VERLTHDATFRVPLGIISLANPDGRSGHSSFSAGTPSNRALRREQSQETQKTPLYKQKSAGPKAYREANIRSEERLECALAPFRLTQRCLKRTSEFFSETVCESGYSVSIGVELGASDLPLKMTRSESERSRVRAHSPSGP
jgi:hypothetical protein